VNPIRAIRETYHAVVPRLRDEGGWRRPIRGLNFGCSIAALGRHKNVTKISKKSVDTSARFLLEMVLHTQSTSRATEKRAFGDSH
jgi:hypothetical protein